ncbi:MAG: hypothetical protein EBY64_03880 [Rhodobacteraceae bacterium]|nr:hypothetical protein [Paracoccaceae bacterium]
MMYSIRMGKTAYDTQNENSANHYAVHSQLWNIDRNADADNVVCKIDEMIYINGIVCDRRTLLTTLLRTIQHIFGTELTDDGCWVVAKITCLN